MKLLSVCGAVEQLEDPQHRDWVRARTRDAAEVVGVCRKVDAHRRVLGAHSLTVERDGLVPQVPHVGLQVVDPLPVPVWLAVAGDDPVEVERLQPVERLDPLVDVPVAHVGETGREHVSGDDHAVIRQVDDDIALRVGAPEEVELDLASALIEREPLRERRVGGRGDDLLQLGVVGTLTFERGLQLRARRRVRHRVERRFHLLDPPRDRSHE